jgi:hypothetical protein
VTATLSVDAVQARLTWGPATTTAVKPAGVDGFSVSGAGVLALAVFEKSPRLPAASMARTR